MQPKYIKVTWSYACGGGGRGKFPSAKKISSDCKEISILINSTVDKSIKFKNKSKAKDSKTSDSDNRSEHFNFVNL